VIDAERANAIEARLAALVDVPVEDLRQYMAGNIRAGGARRTGFKFVRGTHGGHFVRDPNGTDILPSDFEVPAKARASR
jgi:hypothetical protein